MNFVTTYPDTHHSVPFLTPLSIHLDSHFINKMKVKQYQHYTLGSTTQLLSKFVKLKKRDSNTVQINYFNWISHLLLSVFL